MPINIYEQDITLDLNSNSAYVVVNAKQGDQNTRKLNINFTKDGQTYALASDSNLEMVFRLRKPDGTAVILEQKADSSNIGLNNDGSAWVLLEGQSLAAAGRGYADILQRTTLPSNALYRFKNCGTFI